MSFFYRHYKNKDYKYIGIAKHSETLEDLVVYRCLYDNPTARLWVRPRELFESLVVINGQEQRRFSPVLFEIRGVSRLEAKERSALDILAKKVFPNLSVSNIDERLKIKNAQLLLAYFEGELVGFKMGYEQGPGEFYSWLGGVSPQWRGRGVATELMRAQHQWCENQGFQSIFTKTKNSFREMLMLNLRAGFKVVGLEELSPEPKIVLKKSITGLQKIGE